MPNTPSDTLTLKQAVEGVPNASWTDSSGELWSSQEVASQWSKDTLQQPVVWGETEFGRPTIREAGNDGQPGKTLLTMEPPSGADLPSPPAVEPEE